MKAISKLKYHFHLFLHNHNQALIKDARCEQLKTKLRTKAHYHYTQAKRVRHPLACESGSDPL